jgi:4-azaleucine resistance transporter AzlC
MKDWQRTLIAGMKAAWPICVGYVPIGLAFGVLAQKAGIQPLAIGAMSLLVFAGSAQFIAVSMLSAGADPVSIILTTFIVNLRHILMSSSLSVYLQNCSRKFLSLAAYGVTDESFAVNLTRFRTGSWTPREALAVNQISNAAWISSTIVGGYCGELIPEGSFGIDYALSAMFISLLVLQLRGRLYILTALISGFLAVLLSVLLPGNVHVMTASLLAATLGFLIKRKASRQVGDTHA